MSRNRNLQYELDDYYSDEYYDDDDYYDEYYDENYEYENVLLFVIYLMKLSFNISFKSHFLS